MNPDFVMTLDDLLRGTRGVCKNTHGREFTAVTIDSRKDVERHVFFAIKGDVHDGHEFISDVVKKNAGAVIAHEWRDEWRPLLDKTTWIQVDDTLRALQDMAHYWRGKWGKTVLAVTGSNGKTSVKDFAHTFLSAHFSTLKSEGSFNNHWGLPLTLLKLRDTHDVAMIEMGMNHAGEIARLCEIANPDIVVVNNIGRAHVEHFGGLEGIARAKEEIYQGLSPAGTGVFNLADPFTAEMHERYKNKFSRIITFGSATADVQVELTAIEAGGLRLRARIGAQTADVFAPVWGEHNVLNLTTAAALALAAGVPSSTIFQNFEKCQTGWGRNQWVKLKTGQALLFDGYNANPDSFAALLKNIETGLPVSAEVLAVFGEMREQGTKAPEYHRELGQKAAASRIKNCIFIGESRAFFEEGFKAIDNAKTLITSDSYQESLALKIKSMLQPKTLVIVKGSRGGALERVVSGLDPLNFSTK